MASCRIYCVFIAFAVLSSCGRNDGIAVGNIVLASTGTSGADYSYSVGNYTENEGDIVTWFIQDGQRRCERIFRTGKMANNTLAGRCPTLKAGNVDVAAGWASNYPDIASIAQRVE